ncbi:hypothetical protein CYMTET_14928 [Cymbomonas tetramitiformis]|uniref:Uncharacterized protein n=1 Tax=Cymbomonas tetramitiformis TaxID=36881 RepID=A0AAE0GFE0_9CHLO|nr:hypothetical protein CYMTET_14928 [Cymbomonas tetramitiformis]
MTAASFRCVAGNALHRYAGYDRQPGHIARLGKRAMTRLHAEVLIMAAPQAQVRAMTPLGGFQVRAMTATFPSGAAGPAVPVVGL